MISKRQSAIELVIMARMQSCQSESRQTYLDDWRDCVNGQRGQDASLPAGN